MLLTVICLREGGMFRGAKFRHPYGAVTHPAAKFTADELRAMLAERDLVVVAGENLTIADVEKLTAAPTKAKK